MQDKLASLTPETQYIMCEQGTEPPHSGRYNLTDKPGTYLCRRCGHALFRSTQKFISSCGWPSFDDELPGRIHRLADPDGHRTEIRCQRCDGHLGHVFLGEGYSAKNQRHCVNSASIDFASSNTVDDTEEAIFAGGCFWGIEHLFRQQSGVIFSEVGYCGGRTHHPTYKTVCSGHTGHLEAVRIIFDVAVTNYTQLTQFFFEIHNPAQHDGQGPDIGSQYLSAIFYHDPIQHRIAEQLTQILKDKGLAVTTQLRNAAIFWPAEEMHQRYYEKTGGTPYCHTHRQRF